jgi:hypothetical protein
LALIFTYIYHKVETVSVGNTSAVLVPIQHITTRRQNGVHGHGNLFEKKRFKQWRIANTFFFNRIRSSSTLPLDYRTLIGL